MAETATIARPYAEALFRVAKFGGDSTNTSGRMNAWSDFIAEAAEVAAHPDVLALAHNPKVSADQTAEIFVSLLKSPITEEAKNLLQTLSDYDRLTVLPEIAAQFFALKNADAGAADAEIYSAFELSADQVNDLAVALEKKFGRKLQATVKLDSSLIGGVRIVVGDQVLDTSVRAKLQKMQVALTA